MTTPIRAWHGDPAVKANAVRRMREHRAQDEIRQNAYVWLDPTKPSGFRGCFHGCLTAEALGPPRELLFREEEVGRLTDWHLQTELLFGIPQRLGALLDTTFEALPAAACAAFAVDTIEAIPVGADLSGVPARLAADALSDMDHGIPHGLPAPAAEAVAAVADLWRRRADGDEPADPEWTQARDRLVAVEEIRVVAARRATTHSHSPVLDAFDLADAADADAFATWLAARIVHHLAAAPVPEVAS